MPDQSMIERVADALAEAEAGDYRSIAIAVLTAMREPTKTMEERAFNHMEANGTDPRFAWEAMIDAALEDGENG